MDPLFEKKFITTKNAAGLSGYTPDYLARLIRMEKVVGKKIGHSWLIDNDSLERFLGRHKDRKTNYARALARSRKEEYLLHQDTRRSAQHQGKQKNNGSRTVGTPATYLFAPAEPLGIAGYHSLGSHLPALSIATFVIIFGALAAQSPALPQLAQQTAVVANEIVSGFGAAFGDIPLRITAGVANARTSAHEVSKRAVTDARVYSEISYPLVALALPEVDAPSLKNGPPPAGAAPAAVSARTLEDLRLSVRDAYARIAHPSRGVEPLVRSYVALGERIYTALAVSLQAYRSFIERSAGEALALAASVRDAFAALPSLVDRTNLAFGTAIIDATHAAIRADVALSYIPPRAAPALARTVFNIEYAGAVRFVAFADAISEGYLSLVQRTGRFAYEGVAGTRNIFNTARQLFAENTLLSALAASISSSR